MGEPQRSRELMVPVTPVILEIRPTQRIAETPEMLERVLSPGSWRVAYHRQRHLMWQKRWTVNYARAVTNGKQQSTATSTSTSAVSQSALSVAAGTSVQHRQMAAASSRRERPSSPTNSRRRPMTLRGIAPVRQRAEFFVSKFDPLTTANDILTHVRGELNTEEVLCEQIHTLNGNYSSFKVTVDNRHYKRMITSNMWPEYVVFRKYYQPRNSHYGSS